MPLGKDDIKELTQAISDARKREVNFGLALGKKPEETALNFHRIKDGAALMRLAKKSDGVEAAKSCFGTAQVEGKLLVLMCLSDPPAGIRKRLKAFLKAAQLPMKVRILLPDDSEFEAGDGEDEDATAAPPPDAAKSEPITAEPDLVPRIKETQQKVMELADPARETLLKVLKAAATSWSKGDKEKTIAYLDQIDAVLAKLPNTGTIKPSAIAEDAPPPPPPPAQDHLLKSLQDRLRRTAGSCKSAIDAEPQRKEKLVGALAQAKSALEAKDVERCIRTLDAIDKALAMQFSKNLADPRAVAAELRDIWDKAKSQTDSQLDKLLARVRSSSAPAAKPIADLGLSAWSGGANSALMRALLEVQAASPDKLPAVAKKARVAFGAYRDFIQMHPAVGMLENNHYGIPVNLTSELGHALTKMEQKIAAF